jgi:hypothetical protein
MDVAKAGELVGKVAGGNTGILSRYGIRSRRARPPGGARPLQKKFAGQAEAYGKTTAGAGARASVAWENLQETLGQALLPVLAKVGNGLAGVFAWMQRNKGATQALVATVGAFVGVLGAVMVVTKVVTALKAMRVAVVAVNVAMRANPIGLVITALTLLGVGLVAAYKKSETFRRIVDGAFSAVKSAAKAVAGAVTDAIGWVKTAFENAVKWVRGAIRDIRQAISSAKGAIGDAARAVAGAAMDGFSFIKRLPGRVGGWVLDGIRRIGALERRGFNAAVNLGQKLVSGVLSGLGNLGHVILAKVKDALGWVGSQISGAASSLGKKLLGPLGDGVGKTASGLGFMGSSGGPGSLMGADRDLMPFASIAGRMGLQTTSGLRPGSITSSGNVSYHSSGDAIDESGPPGAMMRFFKT